MTTHAPSASHDGSVELVLDSRAELGEGPVWDTRAGVLVWVDILAGHVHRYDPATGADSVTDVGQPVGAVGLRESGGLVLAVRDGFALLDEDGPAPRPLAAVEREDLETRMNDGEVDPAGRFWAGTMELGGALGRGSLYRLDPGGAVTRVLADVSISNGLGWSPDERTLYYIDSPTQRIDAYDYDRSSGAISNRRTVVEIEAGDGLPDGLTVDAEGFLWVALWGGSAVHRYAPDGRLDQVVELPVSQVTSCAFGGSDLAELYVTSAWAGLEEQQRRAESAAGGLFRLRPGVRGLPARRFAG
jgi:sugar lactone lactonase YvrE